MLIGLMVPFAGSAVGAEAEIVKFTSSFKYVDNDSENVGLGTVTILQGEAYNSYTRGGTVYATITLPSGVNFSNIPSGSNGITNGSIIGATDDEITVQVTTYTGEPVLVLDFSNDNLKVDISADVTGDIKVAVKVWNYNNNAIAWERTENLTVARVKAGDVSITADSPEKVKPGSGQVGAKITIKEAYPGALESGDQVKITIKKTGVKWDKTSATVVTPSGLSLETGSSVPANVYSFTNSDKTMILKVAGESSAFAGKIVITPAFVVEPSASEGNLEVEVSGDVPTTTLVVATVGEGKATVSVENEDKDTLYLGQKALFDDVKVVIEPESGFKFKDGDYITLTLPSGVKWDKDNAPVVAFDPSTNIQLQTVYNDDRSVWFTFTGSGVSSKFKIKDLKLVAKGSAEVGDLMLTLGGAVSGTVKIGKVANPIQVSASGVPTLAAQTGDQKAGDIYITEIKNGTLKKDTKVRVVLPMGVEFTQAPDVKVDSGDITIAPTGSSYLVDKSTIEFQITGASNVTSTIKISKIKYDVSNQAAYGDIGVKVFVGDFETPVAKVANATIVSPTKRTAVFTLGSNVYTVNGVSYTMDVAAYVKDGRTYLPVRYVAYALGVDPANVLWDDATQTVTLIKGTNAVQLTIGSKVLKLNGISITMDVAPELVSGRTMLPFRFIAQALGASVSWDEATQTVTMNLE